MLPRRVTRSPIRASWSFALGVLLWCASLGRVAAAELSVGQSRLGNIFIAPEEVEIPVETGADSIDWKVTDFFGKVVEEKGERVVDGGKLKLKPHASDGQRGYFDLHLSAKRGGAVIAEADTAFVVLAPAKEGVSAADSPFGVMCHFAQGWNPEIMPPIAKAGIRHLRDEQYWHDVERSPGEYVFSSRYRDYMAAAKAHGIEPLIELTFDNALYDRDANGRAVTPHTDAGREGYARYGKALLDHYGPQISTVEVWNEYNGTWCTGPAAGNRPKSYATMLATTYARLKKAHPQVRVLGGASVMVPLPWFEDLFAAGAYQNLDAVAVHPYPSVPESVESEVASLKALMRKVSGDGSEKPIWVTECGMQDTSSPSRRAMARYLVQIYTLLLSQNVERVYWYLFKDHEGVRSGLIRGENDPLGRYAPTSAYAAYANVIRQFGRRPKSARRETTDSRTRVYAFETEAGPLRVAWSTAPPARLVFAADQPLRVIDLMGGEQTMSLKDGAVEVAVGADPIFVWGNVKAIREVGRDLIVADSINDFAGVQKSGEGQWEYGAHAGNGAYSPDRFEPLTWTRMDWGYLWQGKCPYANVSHGGGHPGVMEGRAVWSVRRWTSSAAGPVRITGFVERSSNNGDGTGAKIFIDGTEVFSTLVGAGQPQRADWALPATLKRGSRVDFALTPGAALNIDFDAVQFSAQITQPAAQDSPKGTE